MPNLPQDTVRELRQSLTLLKRLVNEFSQALTIQPSDIARLKRASDRVRALTPTDQFEAWVGGQIAYSPSEGTDDEDIVLEILKGQKAQEAITSTGTLGITEHLRQYAHSLYFYVEEIVENEELEDTMNRLTQENTSLKKQLAELSRREQIYLSIIKEAQTTASYSVPPENGHDLCASYQNELEGIERNLHRLREQEVMHGLIDTPLHILNSIEEHEKRRSQILAYIATSKAGKTDESGNRIKWI